MNDRNFREEGLILLREKLPSINLQRHCFAVEAIMRALARYYGESDSLWGLAGLMHDVDYEETKKDLGRHSLLAAEWLEERGFSLEVVKAVKVHNEMHGIPLETRMERALTFADGISGLIVAAALITPSKKIVDLKVKSVLKRFKEKDFARGVNREEIMRCETEGLSLAQFTELSVLALQGIAQEIGL